MNLLRQRQLFASPRGNEMELDASVILLFGGAKAGVSQVWSDPCAISTGAASEHDRDRINESVIALADLPLTACEQLFDEQFKGWSKFIQAVIEALIGGQTRKPLAPMIQNVIIDAALCGQSLEMPEQVHS